LPPFYLRPSSRLKLIHMRIKDKLFLAFGVYLLFAALFGCLIYTELRIIKKKLMLVETADDITSALLEVRRYEKNFLLFRDDKSLDELKKYVALFKGDVNNIRAEIIAEIGSEDYYKIKKNVDEYGQKIVRIVENFRSQDELVTILRTSGRRAERLLEGAELEKLLVIRRHEKNLMLYKDQASYDNFRRYFAHLSPKSRETAGSYPIIAGKLFDLYRNEKLDVENLRLQAREIESITENLSESERRDINRILSRSTGYLLFGFFGLVVIGTLITLKLGFGIVDPIRELERVTKKIAGGDLGERVEIRGKDELTSLAFSFNQMEIRLQDTLKALESTIDELKEKQERLVGAEKLASIGILSAGIAHEINNPLTSILTFSNLLLEKMPPEDPNRERVAIMARETFRARTIVRQLLFFAKETPMKKELICVNLPVQEIIDSLKAQDAFKEIELKLDLSEEVPEIMGDPVQIGQVVLNLLLNAIHSITPPGKIFISTQANGRTVELVIGDTGCGIPRENLGRIFDPFFTTKEVKGSGLGLAVSYGIIKKHGGDIEVRSIPGKGSVFTVKLPVNG
jgi:signal transduction histidine kinase